MYIWSTFWDDFFPDLWKFISKVERIFDHLSQQHLLRTATGIRGNQILPTSLTGKSNTHGFPSPKCERDAICRLYFFLLLETSCCLYRFLLGLNRWCAVLSHLLLFVMFFLEKKKSDLHLVFFSTKIKLLFVKIYFLLANTVLTLFIGESLLPPPKWAFLFSFHLFRPIGIPDEKTILFLLLFLNPDPLRPKTKPWFRFRGPSTFSILRDMSLSPCAPEAVYFIFFASRQEFKNPKFLRRAKKIWERYLLYVCCHFSVLKSASCQRVPFNFCESAVRPFGKSLCAFSLLFPTCVVNWEGKRAFTSMAS